VSLQDEIFAWVRNAPPWKQELYLRAAVSPQLSTDDVREVTAMLLGDGASTPGPRLVCREDLPGAEGAGESMSICSLSDARGVNLLAEDETLAFEGVGLNVVYGKNGAGKTGYARIIKHAGRTLRRETVLSNPAEPDGPPPSATITVAIGGAEHRVPLDLDAPAPALLARICVADSLGDEQYLTADTEVDYAPAVLASLTRLASGLKAVGVELDRQLACAQPRPLDLRPFGEGTEVSRVVASLSAATTEESIAALATLAPEERQQMIDLRRKRGEINAMQAPKLRKTAERSAANAEQLAADLRMIETALGAGTLHDARARRDALLSARQAAELAAASFSAEPFPGVGSEAWRRLWHAARAFAEHQDQQIPPKHEPASCPLCMQKLAPDARARLARFDEFVKAEINVQVGDAEKAIALAHDALPDIATVRTRNAEALSLLAEDSDRTVASVDHWLQEAEIVAAQLRTGDPDGLTPVEPAPVKSVETWRDARSAEAAAHAALEDASERQRVQASLGELEAREELQHRLSEVLAHLAGLRELERLTAAKRKIGTTTLSTLITGLSRQLVEADLQGSLNRHLHALNFQGLEVTVKSKTVRGRPMVSLRFKTVADVPLNSVLSQGEQRRLALAMFLAEMDVLGDASPIVLDDPVSSIDQEGRRHIAGTLSELARARQVIVFTHELSFVHELRRHARRGVPAHFQHVCRQGHRVGHVREGLPWEGQTTKQRRQSLHDRLGELRAHHEAGDLDNYRRDVTDFCWALRSSFERAVEEDLLGGTVTRRDDTIHTKNLQNVILDDEICALVDRGVDECSPWAHDQPLPDGADPPTPAELREGLDLYCELLDRVKKSRRTGDKPPTAGLKALDPTDDVTAARGSVLLAVPDEPGASADQGPPSASRSGS
jgi:ABC-type dipeptide/oligopeptide/nickel transport system ATPase subunit